MVAIRAMRLLSIAILLAMPAPLAAETQDDLTSRIAAVQAFARGSSEEIWHGYGSAPFSVLIVDAERETLLCRPSPPEGFTVLARDRTTGCETAARPRSGLPDTLLAAMPIFGPPSTIVVGTPSSTGLGPAGWSRVMLHEHFHQWQAALPGYYDRVSALDLADGDETGMWMLNFAFPYDDPDVIAAHRSASLALAEAIAGRGAPNFRELFDRYLVARSAFTATVDARAWRYVEFQLWQEGVARWTEIELGLRYPDPDVRTTARELEARTLAELSAPDLQAQRRLFAYPFGAGEAMLLEACDPNWRLAYGEELALGPLIHRCGPAS